MARQTTQAAVEDLSPEGIVAPGELIAPAPRVSVQAFCETAETAAAIQAAGEDRRLAKAHLSLGPAIRLTAKPITRCSISSSNPMMEWPRCRFRREAAARERYQRCGGGR